MMDSLPADIVIEQDVAEFCAAQAEAIRVLAKRTAADMIEIGQRLIAVSGKIERYHWQQWITDEFGWSENTARRFMRIAQSSASLADLSGCEIDASTLYMLTTRHATPEWRDAVIEAAQSGEHITLEAAEKLAAEQVAEAIEHAKEERASALRIAQHEYQQALEDRTRAARSTIEQLKDALHKAGKANQEKPSLDDAISMVCKLTGKAGVAETRPAFTHQTRRKKKGRPRRRATPTIKEEIADLRSPRGERWRSICPRGANAPSVAKGVDKRQLSTGN